MNETEKTSESVAIGPKEVKFLCESIELGKREHTLHAFIKLHNRIEAEFDRNFILAKGGGDDREKYLNIAEGLLKALRIVTEEIKNTNFIEEENK